MSHHFHVGKPYTRRDIYKIIGVPADTKGGNWDTGYNQYNNDWFIFCNIGIPGRTGHNYGNTLIGDNLVWYGKTGSQLKHASILSMLHGTGCVYIFAREDNSQPFIYLGVGKAMSVEDSIPVKITWQFTSDNELKPHMIAEEVAEHSEYIEGATKQIYVNVYERNLVARHKCIEFYGYNCAVCGFNFCEHYGAIGDGFIHVHHLKPLAEIREEYHIDPIQDLRPVCPNCHAMLHQKKPAYTIEELQQIVKYPPR